MTRAVDEVVGDGQVLAEQDVTPDRCFLDPLRVGDPLEFVRSLPHGNSEQMLIGWFNPTHVGQVGLVTTNR
jgi:hypothetical protein